MDSLCRPITILLAEDDSGDRQLTQRGLEQTHLAADLRCVADGEELLAYLHRHGRYADAERAPRPALILLDLNLPVKDGREVLGEIKRDAGLRRIPVVVLTSSRKEEDVYLSYDLGVNSVITKPITFGGLVDVMKVLVRYWFEIGELPPG
jgi:CheY-like chemotaxis protein